MRLLKIASPYELAQKIVISVCFEGKGMWKTYLNFGTVALATQLAWGSMEWRRAGRHT